MRVDLWNQEKVRSLGYNCQFEAGSLLETLNPVDSYLSENTSQSPIFKQIRMAGLSLLAIAAFYQVAMINAREITFPPPSGYTSQHIIPQGYREPDVTSPKFAGLATYANLPYVHCLAPEGYDVEPFDIAILGAPFDTGVTGRPGARFGPQGIRSGSWRIHPEAAWSVYTGKFKHSTRIGLTQLTCDAQIVSSRPTKSSKGTTPRMITLGGDHTTTLSALRSASSHWGPVSVIHFDSHLDTWDPEVLGMFSSGHMQALVLISRQVEESLTMRIGVNHGTFLHIAHEEGLIRNSSVHAGIRAPMVRPKGDLRNDVRCGFEIIKAREIDRYGVAGVIERLKARVSDTKVYISVDIDVLDPAFAPATGTAEVGGWSTRELLSVLDGLDGLDVVGADVVEVAPIYDNAGESTVLAAAEIVLSLIGLMVNTPVSE
ncbi:hypothetical protein LEMA_P036660.1 [Plenodomus lingam JN3]|uniref:Agmatinase n=1 Tax=Leptosphaeria maculans (strain JN3 / isolate v23.1.3 / race Av1-4-5-6-7-8) TaxID=985895 RepID=E4ZQI7_LEPMJ|nr:hypothetical protein LEMA_P036660.1 [Plenodomus lingam JN3]CBX93992.1 hypothetical protein LEMA_P036660.1 [Plenodomus lingam JN3]